MRTTTTNLGDLITTLYDEFMALYQDEELASLATAATVNDLLVEESVERRAELEEAAA